MSDGAQKQLRNFPRDSAIAKSRVGTLGMFIIDQYQVSGETGTPIILAEESIGGGGIFAMIAARIFLPASRCSLIVDEGTDFPDKFRDELFTFGKEMIWLRKREQRTTRALNIYSGSIIGDGQQSFQYLSPQLHLWPKDFIKPTSPFADPPPDWIHVVSTSERAYSIVDDLQETRKEQPGWEPKLVWEPLGRSCTPANLDGILEIAHHFAVFSPNLLEMQNLLGRPQEDTHSATEEAASYFDELLVHRHLGRRSTTIIVRAGPMGSYTLSAQWRGWVPAYWKPHEQDQVVDVTGGGNAWLGGLCAGLSLSDGDIRYASICASTAASFAIQQRGLPNLTTRNGVELWNGADPRERLNRMLQRMDRKRLNDTT